MHGEVLRVESLLAEVGEEVLDGAQAPLHVAAVGDLTLSVPRDLRGLELIDGALGPTDGVHRAGEAVEFLVCVSVEFVCTLGQVVSQRITDIQGWAPLRANRHTDRRELIRLRFYGCALRSVNEKTDASRRMWGVLDSGLTLARLSRYHRTTGCDGDEYAGPRAQSEPGTVRAGARALPNIPPEPSARTLRNRSK